MMIDAASSTRHGIVSLSTAPVVSRGGIWPAHRRRGNFSRLTLPEDRYRSGEAER